MKNICKFLVAFSLLLFSVFFFLFTGCNEQDYTKYLSELRQNVYVGNSEEYSLRAKYGFNLKAKSEAKYYTLSFIILNETNNNTNLSLLLSHNGLEYKANFSLEPALSKQICNIEIENFNLSAFEVTILNADKRQTIEMQSEIPEGALSYSDALTKLWENQPELMNSYIEDDIFNGRLIERILIKDGKPYYYIGIEQHSKLKAFLLDGYTGEVVAVRNVFS